MCIAAAVIGAAVIGAAGAAYAGHEAAGATQSATNAAISQQQSALSQQNALSQPYRDLATSSVNGAPSEIQTLQSLTTPGPNQTATLRQMPGYQFAQTQGTQGTINAATAMGLGLSGNTLQGLSQFNQGLADQTFQQEVGNVENVVGIGQAAAAGQAANIGNAAGNISGALINQGNTIAGIDANVAAGITKSIGNATNQYTTLQTLSALQGGYSGWSGSLDPGSTMNDGGYILQGYG